jgi:hypothetical protein
MSSQFVPLVSFCCLVVTALSVDIPANRVIINPPLNEAIEYGPEVVLGCEASGPSERVQWTEYITNPNGAPISDNGLLLPGHPNFARYTLDNPAGSSIYNLAINPTVLADGGTYRCYDISDSSRPAYAQLVMLDGTPNCTTNIPDDGLVIEDQYYTIECYLGYRGNAAPLMTWTGPDRSLADWLQASTTTNVTVWSGVSMTMTRFFAPSTFSLLVNFTERGFLLPDSATNIPTWNYTYSTAALDVKWAPKNMYRTPEKVSYEIGDEIQCFADANPTATYYWRNLDTLEVYDDNRLLATDRLVGTQRMQCHAENLIGDVLYTNDYFFNFTVNARTTTPVPTTPTTTTPPLPESECDDLTGRWTASTPSFADVCIEVDNTRNGRIVGLFRNASDPFFIEIRGRVAPYKYNQVGFTGVWPVNIGTLSFNGICRKCFGTEILQVTGVGRKVTDNPSCQDAGPQYQFANYEFRRTGPPCRALFQEYNVKF